MSKTFEIRLSSFWIYPSIFVFFLAVYSPAIFIKYAFLDSYAFLASAREHHLSEILEGIIQGGRPLYALYTKEIFGAAGGLGDLGYIRAIGVAGIGVVSAFVYRSLSQTTLPYSVAISGALLFCLTPSYQVYAAWAVASAYPWACIVSAAAFSSCNGISNLRSEWPRFFGSILLLTASITIYQPAGMVFWDFAAIAWLLRATPPSIKSIFIAGAAMCSSLALDFGMTKLIPMMIYGSQNHLSRTALVQNYSGKAIWFFRNPILDSLNIFSIAPTIHFALFLMAVIIPGFFLFFERDFRQTSIRLGLAAFLIPASYLPNLLVAENWASYRTQVALTGLIVIFSMIAFVGWARFLKAHRFVPALCALAVAGIALTASQNITTEFAVPQAIEYHLVENALLKTTFNQNNKICFNLAQWQETFSPIVRYDEFGLVSSTAPWVPASMSWLILTEHHSAYADLFSIDNKNSQQTSIFPGCKEIDLNNILSRHARP